LLREKRIYSCSPMRRADSSGAGCGIACKSR